MHFHVQSYSSTIFTAIMFVILPIYYLKLLFHLLSYRLFDIRYPKYYKLEESTMSPSSIVLETYARYIRILPSMCISFLGMYLLLKIIFNSHSFALFWVVCFLILLFVFIEIIPRAFRHGPITTIPKIDNFFIQQMVSWMGYSEQILRQKNKSEEFERCNRDVSFAV